MIIHLSHTSQCFSHSHSYASFNSNSLPYPLIVMVFSSSILASNGTGYCGLYKLSFMLLSRFSKFLFYYAEHWTCIFIRFAWKFAKKSGWSHQYMLLMFEKHVQNETHTRISFNRFWNIEFVKPTFPPKWEYSLDNNVSPSNIINAF